ncbi:MAG: SGNH/GDSL hydrolase family protein [Actinomycetota bacterium]
MRTSSVVPLTLIVVAALAGCSGGGGAVIEQPVPPVTGDPVVYVAIGASETAGVGTQDPFTQAWPKVLWRTSLPDAVLYDLGRPGSTLAEAISEQLSQAVALEPDIVTVWLNVNDLASGVTAETYRQELTFLLTQLTADGSTTVLVATTPRIDSLPIYLACRPNPPVDAPVCPAPDIAFPAPRQVRAAVESYNRAIEQVAARTGAVVVDLQAYGDAPSTHPEWIADDGFHPSAEGAKAIADAFAQEIPVEVANAASSATP